LVVRDGKLVGIVTRANLLHALATVAAETKPGRPVTRPFASGSMRNSRASRGRRSDSSTWWCATESCTFRARCSMSATAARSVWPRKTSPELRPSKIILSGSTRCPGWSCRHRKSPRRKGKPPDARVALRCCDRDKFVLSVDCAAAAGAEPAHEAIADERGVAHRLPDPGLVVDLRRREDGPAVIEAPRYQLLEVALVAHPLAVADAGTARRHPATVMRRKASRSLDP